MQHCAFVVTAERFREVEGRLKSRGIDYIGPIPQLPGLLGIYFYDPNGIEFARQPEDGEMPAVIPCITRRKQKRALSSKVCRAPRPNGSKGALMHSRGDGATFLRQSSLTGR